MTVASPSAWANGDRQWGGYVEAGQTLHGGDNTNVAAAGALVPWSPMARLREGPLSFNWDLFVSQWRAPAMEGHRSFSQLGAIATLRYRFSDGASRWFAEAGIGATMMDRVYRTTTREFSTTFQFTEVLGMGYSFGARQEHELSLRLQHFSNAGIKKPNPGENFVRLRYAYRF